MSQEEKCLLISLLVRLITSRLISGFPQYNLGEEMEIIDNSIIEYLVFPIVFPLHFSLYHQLILEISKLVK